MEFEIKLPRRKNIRAKGYDYSQSGAYFVTICSRDKSFSFGEVIHNRVELNPIGEIVRNTWVNLPNRFARVVLDEFIVMPNHFHGILALVGAGLAPPGLKIGTISPPGTNPNEKSPKSNKGSDSLSAVIGTFKSMSTIEVNRHLHHKGQPLWQRNYYEHIIRNGEDMQNIQRYIMENPLNWLSDPENFNQKPG